MSVTTHGLFGTKAYSTWNSMVMRCHNPQAQAYANYGGRGITVCASWRVFENFYADMGEPNGLTLERKNNELGYSKENCQWVTMKAQQNNKRSNVVLEYAGYSKNITQWAEHLGVDRQLLYSRHRLGWSPGRILSTPKRGSLGVRKA